MAIKLFQTLSKVFRFNRWLLLAVLLFASVYLKAQLTESLVVSSKSSTFEFEAARPFNALIIKSEGKFINQTVLSSKMGSWQLSVDEHVLHEENIAQSNLVFFDEPVAKVELKGLIPKAEMEIILLRLPDFIQPPKVQKHFTDCAMPDMISQAVWRAGLPDPDYERIQTEVKNIIIHHSATSNSVSDFYGLVRSIYIYHTQSNGWSDIGYNILIAPDGTIFAGRDPGLLIAQDEVMGAHFCASNSGTMGICMLGTFMNESPTEEALFSLNKLIAWKTAKDSLAPFGFADHPLQTQLNTIAGHRNGCSTLCPGDALFAQLHPIREDCNHELENCGVYLSETELNQISQIKLFPNPSNDDKIRIQLPVDHTSNTGEINVQITDIHSKTLINRNIAYSNTDLEFDFNCKPGIYFISVLYNNHWQVLKYIRVH